MIRAILTILCLMFVSTAVAETIAIEREHRKWEQPKFGKSVVLRPVLRLPAGPGPFALVVIVNSSGGAGDIFLRELPKALNNAGIAAAALDTFTPRGIDKTILDQSRISTFTMALDALAVARGFARDPRIDPDRIMVAGHSKGGSTVLRLANAQFYKRFGARPGFAVGVAFSPGCFVQFSGSVSVFPLHALMGGKDDVTLPRYCIPLLDRLNGNPHAVSYDIVPDTYHSWSRPGPSINYVASLPNLSKGPCARDAPFFFDAPNRLRSARTGAVLSMKELKTQCAGGYGKTFGGGRENLQLAFGKAIAWIKAATAGR